MQIGVAGLGRMGAAMAARLIEVGHGLTVWNRSAAKAQLSSVLGTSLQQLDNSLNQLSNVSANVGARINLVSSTANSVNTNTTSVTAQISAVGDLDYAQASSKYSQQLVALQAAEQSYVAIENLSLFKVLGGG